MKKEKTRLILLFLGVIAGAVSGAYFLYAGQFITPFALAGILYYLAAVSPAVLIHRYRNGIMGKHLTRARFTTAILGIPLIVCTVVTILAACGVDTILPLRTQTVNRHTEFSFKEDKQRIDLDSPSVKTARFVNTDEMERALLS